MIPFLVLSDAPNQPTGLGRIARDLTARLHAESQQLGIRVGQAALRWDGSPWPWPVYPVEDEAQWGRRDLPGIWSQFTRNEPGILFSIWDPGRCYGTSELDLYGCRRWGYFAIDAENRHGTISGPAAEAVKRYERVIAYGRWGANVLRPVTRGPVAYLPHGIDLDRWQPQPGAMRKLVGAVATNQPRKDLGLLFETFALLRDADPSLHFWLHTDLQVTPAWSVPQLAEDFGFNKEDSPLILTLPPVHDDYLRGLYSQCLVTIAPGLGEGFGYPIVESLACGAPVIHGDYAGGAELIPMTSWKPEPRAWRYEGAYCLKRPVFDAQDLEGLVQWAVEWATEEPALVQAYCRGSVAHLDWKELWPRWRSWFQEGLR